VVGDAEALHAVIAESASHLRPWVTAGQVAHEAEAQGHHE
jgi:hypothetical protein